MHLLTNGKNYVAFNITINKLYLKHFGFNYVYFNVYTRCNYEYFSVYFC
jgi:hypothetical protein